MIRLKRKIKTIAITILIAIDYLTTSYVQFEDWSVRRKWLKSYIKKTRFSSIRKFKKGASRLEIVRLRICAIEEKELVRLVG